MQTHTDTLDNTPPPWLLGKPEAPALDAAGVLRANLAKLSPKDQDFARSLLSARFATPKQEHWIAELAKRATAAPRAAQAVAPGLGAVVAMFAKASATLAHPAVLVATDAGTIKLRIAGSRSRYQGQLQVLGTGRFDERTYYGRVDLEGRYHPSADAASCATAILRALEAFAADPVKVASDYGKLTGVCCFCARALTDKRSTDVGYGPICADRYGLEWGE